MSSVGWDSLPLIPLSCILDYLGTKDALAATSTCRHWRTAIYMYDGRKETLKLWARHTERNIFMCRLFRKHIKSLHVYMDCSAKDLERFMNYTLIQLFDAVNIQELLFIGPSYARQTASLPIVKLQRIFAESLVYKNVQTIQRLGLLGCEMDSGKKEHGGLTKKLEFYSRPLSFSHVQTPADSILTSCNANLMAFSSLQHIIVNYEQINTESLETLSNLSLFSQLTINICKRRRRGFKPIHWRRLRRSFPNGLDVVVNIVAVPQRNFEEIMYDVLVEDMPLTALKVMFCKTLYLPMIAHIVNFHKSTLRELVWADAPYDSVDECHRVQRPATAPRPEFGMCNVNPFILLCWQCTQLRRLVIHGYWIWQYDILGFVRLRNTLEQLEISAVYDKQGCFPGAQEPALEHAVRVLACDAPVLARDAPAHMARDHAQQVNEYTEFPWAPTPWEELPRGLRPKPSHDHRAKYIVAETVRSLL